MLHNKGTKWAHQLSWVRRSVAFVSINSCDPKEIDNFPISEVDQHQICLTSALMEQIQSIEWVGSIPPKVVYDQNLRRPDRPKY